MFTFRVLCRRTVVAFVKKKIKGLKYCTEKKESRGWMNSDFLMTKCHFQFTIVPYKSDMFLNRKTTIYFSSLLK